MNLDKIKTLAFALLAGGFFVSCSDSIDLASVSEAPYQSSDKALAFITDKYGCSNADSLLFSESGSTAFYVNLNKALATSSEYTIAYDETALNDYNLAHGTSYKSLPKSLVTIDGSATVASGGIKSSAVKVSYATSSSLDSLGTYAIPLKVTGSGAQTSTEKGEFVFLVKDITKMPNCCHKANGMQVISCMEINDANPLYNLCFTLKDSGKLFFDQVILFAGNVRNDATTGEVYNFNNENISQCLNYKEKYLAPLQQKGMKVILGILGAVSNFSVVGAENFAAELKAKCDVYNLDGLFFDDEYSDYGTIRPGFVAASSAAFSRLAYECKQAMPNKLIEVYVYSYTSSCVSIDGHQPGEFIDYAIQNYGDDSDLSSNYPGLKKTGMIQASVECARGYGGEESTFEGVKNNGYGGTMVFALAPNRTPMSVLNNIAQGFYGENLVQTGTYEKDW